MGLDGGGMGGVPGGTCIGPEGGTDPSGARGAPVAGGSGKGGCGPSPGKEAVRPGAGLACSGGKIVIVPVALCPAGTLSLLEGSLGGP